MSILPICDEQQFIFTVNEESENIPMKISFSMEFSKRFSLEELFVALDKCMRAADIFSARCVVADGRQYIEFLPYQKQEIPVFDFANEDEYQRFCNQVTETKINNRDKLYYIFIFSISDSYYHLDFTFNHLIFDGISALVLNQKMQEILMNPSGEVIYHPFSSHLDNIANYKNSDKYLVDKKFWEDRFLEISKSEYLFPDVIDVDEAPIKEASFQTSKKFKENLLEYCTKNNISPHIFIVAILAQIINEKNGCKCFYFEIPIGNRLGRNEKNSLGVYEIAPPFIFDFTKYSNIFDLLKSVQKQSTDYYRHKNFDWSTQIASEAHERKYGRYVPQFCFSYLCQNKEPAISFTTLHHHHMGTDILPMDLYISDYHEWQTMTFGYTYWSNYFTEEEVEEIHRDIEAKIENIVMR